VPQAILFVKSGPATPEREAEYNDWYDNTHIPQVLTVPGFIGATRYKTHVGKPESGEGPQYLIVYDLDAENPAEALAELGRRSQTGELTPSDSLASTPPPVPMLYMLAGS